MRENDFVTPDDMSKSTSAGGDAVKLQLEVVRASSDFAAVARSFVNSNVLHAAAEQLVDASLQVRSRDPLLLAPLSH